MLRKLRMWLLLCRMTCDNAPLNAGQDGRHIICRTPPILQDIKTELSCPINIWVEHLADELDAWGLVGVLFFKMHDQPKCSILERCICWSDDDGVPGGLR